MQVSTTNTRCFTVTPTLVFLIICTIFQRRNLTFEFPFYGEKISTVSVTTQG